MWILECDDQLLLGDASVFKGKRLWLRPGTNFIFGRVKDSSRPDLYLINDKTVSRKHLIIEVGVVKAGDVGKIDARSEVTIKDFKTKIGTVVNGQKLKEQRHVLQGDSHEIQMGRFAHLFRITWHPIVLTLSLTTKELKANAAQPILEQFEQLDIKLIKDYDRESTTHVLAKKRNTSKNLQALVNGKYIVEQDSFLKAILTSANRESDLPECKSRLEVDFDNSWPDAQEYLPPQGAEPTQLPAAAYAPDLTRQNVFEGYSFVFIEQKQFDNLLAPITNGGGKAYLRSVIPGETGVDEFVRYVKDLAGEKGLGEFEDGSEGKGVVVVRFGQETGWYADFFTQMSQLLDQRPIEQSEFLDAILRNNASVLRRPLEPAQSGFSAPASTNMSVSFNRETSPPITAQSSTRQRTPAVSTPREPPKTAARSTRTITSRFKGFDDSDMSDDAEVIPTQKNNVAAVDAASQESSMFVSQGREIYGESQAGPSQARSQLTSSRKRPAPVDEVSVMDQLAPTTLGLKRRRLAEQAERRERGEPSPPPAVKEKPKPAPKPEPPKTKKKKPEKDIDVLEIARQRREEEEARAEADRTILQEQLKDIDINAVRALTEMEDMPVGRPTPPPSRAAHVDDSKRWDEKWNGRQNFKKFRRRGQDGIDVQAQKVIVELEEAPKKNQGIGDEYWLESDGEGRRKKKGKGKRKESQSQSASASRGRFSMGNDWDDDDDDAMDISDSAPAVSSTSQRTSTMRSQDTQKVADKTNVSRTSQSQNKRPAAAPLKNPVPAKKAKPIVLEDDSDDSDDDGKFKFRRKK